MTKNELFRIIALAVAAHPFSEERHKQLQTFAVVRSRSEINGEALGKSVVDRFKPYFYSRRWEAHGYNSNSIEYDFPAVFAIELPGNIEGSFLGRSTFCYNIQLACLYPNIEHLDNTIAARAKALSVQEIEQETLAHLVYIMRQVQSSAVFAVTDEDVSGSWYLEQELEFLEEEGEILSYAIDSAKTQTFRKRFEAQNQAIAVDYVDDFTTHKLCGATLTFRNCENLCSQSAVEPSFTALNCCVQR